MPEQNYQQHTQRVPLFMAVGLALVASVIGAGVNLYQSFGDHQRLYSASLIFVLTVCTLIVGFFARTFALKAQDRAIRAEENLRHFAAAGRLLDSKLSMKQIIALRFASDGEFVELAKKAANTSMEPDAIKQAIKNWRADWHRV